MIFVVYVVYVVSKIRRVTQTDSLLVHADRLELRRGAKTLLEAPYSDLEAVGQEIIFPGDTDPSLVLRFVEGKRKPEEEKRFDGRDWDEFFTQRWSISLDEFEKLVAARIRKP